MITYQEQEILAGLIDTHPEISRISGQILKAYELLADSYDKGCVLYVAGNGGSAADSEHIVGELMKTFKKPRPVDDEFKSNLHRMFPNEAEDLCSGLSGGLGAFSLPSFVALSSAMINDVDSAYVYAQPLYSAGKMNDSFIGISTSGNSRNIVNAAVTAKAKNMHVIGLSGASDNRLDEICDVVIHAPSTETYRVQEYHLPIYHALCAMLEERYW